MRTIRRRRGRTVTIGLRAASVVALSALVLVGCGSSSKPGAGGVSATTPKSGGTPVSGGTLVYGLEAETGGGYCLNVAQLAAPGIEVADAIYDTLTVPDEKGGYVPYLAKSVTPSADYKTWTITLRPGVTFHDGTALDAAAVKLNLDAYRKGLLFSFVFANVADTTVVDPLTVRVTMKVPWIGFPSYLFATGRLGMMAPAQINDKAHCNDHPIGTGPFMFKEWIVNDHLTVVKNPHYWRTGLPYLESIVFKPVPDVSQRTNGLKGGQLNLIQTDNGEQIADIRDAVKAGQLAIVENQKSAEIGYTLLNIRSAPFNDLTARQAVAYASDRDSLNAIINKGLFTLADEPFASDVQGYVPNPGYPHFDLTIAKAKVAQYKAAHGGQFRVTLSFDTTDATTVRNAQLVKSQWEQAGITVDLGAEAGQTQLINDALAAKFEAVLWRNHPGGDPDTQYVWWHSGSPVNFNGFSDPQMDQLLEAGRSETDPAKRLADYQAISKLFAQQVYNLWGWYELWAFASQPNVHGVAGPDLPDGGGKQGLVASVHPLVGLWISK